jgi:hypothetical protein
VHLTAGQALAPHPHGGRRSVDPTASHLACLGVQRVERDLPTMHIKPGYDRHQGLLRVPVTCHPARNDLAPSRRRPGSCHLCAKGSGLSAGLSFLHEQGSTSEIGLSRFSSNQRCPRGSGPRSRHATARGGRRGEATGGYGRYAGRCARERSPRAGQTPALRRHRRPEGRTKSHRLTARSPVRLPHARRHAGAARLRITTQLQATKSPPRSGAREEQPPGGPQPACR